jgi:hypothetical protein
MTDARGRVLVLDNDADFADVPSMPRAAALDALWRESHHGWWEPSVVRALVDLLPDLDTAAPGRLTAGAVGERE